MDSAQIYALAKDRLSRVWPTWLQSSAPHATPFAGIRAALVFQQAQVDMLTRELSIVSIAAGCGVINDKLPEVTQLLDEPDEEPDDHGDHQVEQYRKALAADATAQEAGQVLSAQEATALVHSLVRMCTRYGINLHAGKDTEASADAMNIAKNLAEVGRALSLQDFVTDRMKDAISVQETLIDTLNDMTSTQEATIGELQQQVRLMTDLNQQVTKDRDSLKEELAAQSIELRNLTAHVESLQMSRPGFDAE